MRRYIHICVYVYVCSCSLVYHDMSVLCWCIGVSVDVVCDCLSLLVGIEPDTKRIKPLMDQSLMLVTALNSHVGYDREHVQHHNATMQGGTCEATSRSICDVMR